MTLARRVPGALGFLAVLGALTACSSNSDKSSATQGEGDGGGTGHCTQMADKCKASQMICVTDGTNETCQACPPGQYAASADACSPIPGNELAHDFGDYTLDPSAEINGLCQSWTLNNDAEIWVNAVELITGGGYHHSNWLFVPDTKYPGPDGAWMCDERGYTELEAAVAGGVLFAQSTQAQKQVQKFPEGVAVRLPPHARIIGGTHLLSLSDKPLVTDLKLNVFTIDAKDVKVPLAPFRLSYLDLTIQPHAISDFSGTCDFSAKQKSGVEGDLDMDLYYVMPHYHALGHSFRLEKFGGADDGQTIYDLGTFDSEAHGTAFDPPVSMRGSSGFRFTCGFENPRADVVGWGIGDQEMCVMLGFTRSDYAFDATVPKTTSQNQANGDYQYSGDCTVIPIDFAQGKGSLQ